jgi:hypothetical protein
MLAAVLPISTLPPTPYIEDPIQLRPVSHKAIVNLTL